MRMIRVTVEREYAANVDMLRKDFAADLAADGMTDATDDELLRHLYDLGGADNFELVNEDVTDIEFLAGESS